MIASTHLGCHRRHNNARPVLCEELKGWLSSKVGQWAVAAQRRELEEFVARLKALDGHELGLILAMATHQRHVFLSAKGWQLIYPAALVDQPQNVPMQLAEIIKTLQGQGRPDIAAGVMVWLHTVRALQSPDLKQFGREMWGQLERGTPFCEEAAAIFSKMPGGSEILTVGFDPFPEGLSPKPG